MQTIGDNIQYVYVLKEVPVALLPEFDIPLFGIITWRNTARNLFPFNHHNYNECIGLFIPPKPTTLHPPGIAEHSAFPQL